MEITINDKMAEEKLEQKTECPLLAGCGAREERTEKFRSDICGTDNYIHCGYLQYITEEDKKLHEFERY